MLKPILIAASPNTEKDDIILSLKLLLSPFKYNDKQKLELFENKLREDFNSQVFSFDSARSAFYALLKSSNFNNNDEVILPAFSCMVIANAVHWAGLKPIYVDCNKDDFNYDILDLKKKITDKTKVVLVQHTFGFPEDINTIRNIVGEKVMIVEDLAHSIGGVNENNQKLGTLADASIITYGIEKVISGVRGGSLLINNYEGKKELINNVSNYHKGLKNFPFFKTIISLLNPIIWSIIYPIYYLGYRKYTLGRLLVYIFHKLNLFGNMIEDCEYKQCKPNWLPSKISPALSTLAYNQYCKIKKLNNHRLTIANIYLKELEINYPFNSVYLRFPLIVNNKSRVINKMKEKGIVLGDWYKSILYAPIESLNSLGYIKGSCINAHELSSKIINLPTHIKVNNKDALEIIKYIKEND